MLLNKNIDLNNILTDYSLSLSTNSYILSYYGNMYKRYYDVDTSNSNINIESKERIDEETHLKYKNNELNKFNLNTTYYYNENISNNIIISNIGNNQYTYENSYVIYYGINDGLKQLSYHYKEGNGIYYDTNNHLIEMNIDNDTIKEINRKLYFDINSIPISSLENYGISYVDNEYLDINNGILTIKYELIENVISYKYKIKNLYESLKSLELAFSYYVNVNAGKTDTTNWFNKFFKNIIRNDQNDMIERNISYEISNSLYFPQSSLKYIDNYYSSSGLINENYIPTIDLNELNSYIIYCKDVEQITLLSEVENKFYTEFTEFNDNLLNDIESSLGTNIEKSTEIIDSNELYSYIYINEKNKYNKVLFNTNIISSNIKEDNLHYFSYTSSNIKYKSKLNDEKIFKKNGIILNSRLNRYQLEKCIIDYYLVNSIMNYFFKLKKINIKYDERNIKILYDDRDIKYCSYTTKEINEHNYYYFFTSGNSNNLSGEKNLDTGIEIDEKISFIIKNSDVSFKNQLPYLYYGYNFVYNYNINKYNKKYYGIWEDLPTSYITSHFIDNINNENIILFNFNELYTENFNEVEYGIIEDTNEPNMEDKHLLYLCKLDEKTNTIKFAKYNGTNIILNI